MNSKITFLMIFLFQGLISLGQTTIQKNKIGYTLLRDGKPYYVKGVGGEVNFDKMVAIGANSFRTWGVDNAKQVLDEAHKRGLTVMLGLWLQHERHGFDYDNKMKVKQQLDYFKTVINQYKDHPALLLWGIGNELDLDYTNPNVWYAVQDIAKYAHQVDPNHPTSTVTAGLDSLEVSFIKARCPDIDIYCVNTYGDIGNVPANISKFGWAGPYMITEWGPNGHWESPKTAWGVSIEQTSSEKTQSYFERYTKYIEPNKDFCLGSYAFLWGAKQEYTETWYGLFSKDNMPTEPIDALETVFTNKTISKPAPSISKFTINNQKVTENIQLKAEEKYNAEVLLKEVSKNIGSSQVKYRWRIMEESTDKKTGGDKEDEANEVSGLIKSGGAANNQINFRAPAAEGKYRLFVTVISNEKQAYANIPFLVTPRSDTDKQSKFIQFKYTNMNSFEQE
ncbi:MAG TPA: glycoside hydrolase family 2 TIM barrel-domain containing protein [Chitinophagaceae bacterium]|nr:glycoside hydrolase family 2 TIM barrel-domain containing protein [Chitinophagaceae bacterium]